MLLNSLKFINCKKVGDSEYTLEDSNINCDSEYFKNFIFPINLGVSLVLGLIIPLFMFLVLFIGNKR